jgi:endogenous inhibitor of DNA gyrase (YacG/DUF329 family)
MPTIRCPICQKSFDTAASKALPFCSERCKQIDLSRWLDERYTLPVDRTEDADESDSTAGTD